MESLLKAALLKKATSKTNKKERLPKTLILTHMLR